jgi:hypothetical protein
MTSQMICFWAQLEGMNGLRVKDVNDLHINFQTQQTQVSNILVFFFDTDKKLKVWLQQKIGRG